MEIKCEDQYHGENYSLYNGDSCEVIKGLPDNSVDFSCFSPPFENLFIYSNSARDMGNCASSEEFFTHFGFLVKELYRITTDGRLCAVHCSQIPMHKFKDGSIGLKDFRGGIIRCFQDNGWVYHSEVTIWKCPVVEMTRTKAQGLLHKQVCKDATFSRTGMADYLVVFRKVTDSAKPVTRPDGFIPSEFVGDFGPFEGMPAALRNRYEQPVTTSVDVWQRYASPVWFDINQTDVLNARIAKNDKDEKHLCPLQKGVVERAVQLWTNKGDIVFTPFMGIGTEVWGAVNQGRKGIGIELKPEYFRQAIRNMQALDETKRQGSLLAV